MSPLWGFECPDGAIAPLADDLAHCRSCDHRCLTLPTLRYIGKERVWNGRPSTTQLLNGTMLEFLKITRDYVCDPGQDRIFALYGSALHALLAKEAEELNLPAEVALSPDGRDIFDLLEPENGTWTLTDNKGWGSYKVARALGLVKSGKGKDARFVIDPEQADLYEVELQLNNYTRMLEEKGVMIGRMQLQVFVRDGGLAVAKTRGITRNSYIIPIKRLDADYVGSYFDGKAGDLLKALEKYEADPTYFPTPCDNRESWDGNRCGKWCDVAKFCPKGMLGMQEE